jgi:hypothetical protein
VKRYRFKCQAAADFIMTDAITSRLWRILGKHAQPEGIVER